MALVFLRIQNEIPIIQVTIWESYTIYPGSTVQSDSLRAVLEDTADTSVISLSREHSPIPTGDFGDWQLDYVLPVTEPNFAALMNTAFPWHNDDAHWCERYLNGNLSPGDFAAKIYGGELPIHAVEDPAPIYEATESELNTVLPTQSPQFGRTAIGAIVLAMFGYFLCAFCTSITFQSVPSTGALMSFVIVSMLVGAVAGLMTNQ